MSDGERDLVTDEGVDEGSMKSGTEDASDQKASDVFGVRAAGTPENGEQQAAPELVVTGEQAPKGPGQQLAAGEG
jgi:hypothetical protein